MAAVALLPPLAMTGSIPGQAEPVQREIEILEKDVFDATKHIDFVPPSRVHTMQDLNFPESAGVSPVAVSEPFHLFTPDAIHQMRAEVLSSKVWDNCQYSSNLAQCQLRGFASR